MGPSTGPRPASSMPMMQGSACQAASWTMIRPVAGPEVSDAESMQLVTLTGCAFSNFGHLWVPRSNSCGSSDTGAAEIEIISIHTIEL